MTAIVPKKGPVIAIDGPAGTGKSSGTLALCERLGFTHVDTGAMYRAIAFLALEDRRDLENLPISERLAGLSDERVTELAREAHLEFRREASLKPANRVIVNGADVTERIRTPEMGMASSRVSGIPGVRAALLGMQRRLGCAGRTVLEGRDIGTVVFPDADVKFFLSASAATRAKRRHAELLQKGGSVPSLEEIQRQIEERDHQDSTRAVAPLKKADDAIEIDTSGLTLEQVVAEMERLAREKLGL
jgi:cytidylate kinase